jgi:Reverse transcriptase (RNA-dependent DNA polymerase)
MATPDTPLFVKTHDFLLWLIRHTQRFIKEELRIPGYVRYADDLVLFSDEKSQLWDARNQLIDLLAKIRLRLHDKKTTLRPGTSSLKFLGLVLRRSERRLQQSGIRRFNLRLRHDFATGLIDCETVRQSLQAWLAHVKGANTTGIRREIWQRAIFSRESQSHDSDGVEW